MRDHEQAAREARARLTAWKRAYVDREESQRVFEKHGSRAKQPRRGKRRAAEPALAIEQDLALARRRRRAHHRCGGDRAAFLNLSLGGILVLRGGLQRQDKQAGGKRQRQDGK